MEAPLPKPNISKVIEIEKESTKYELELNIESNYLNFTIKLIDSIPILIFSNKYTLIDLEEKCKIFKMNENIGECLNIFIDFFEKKNYSLIKNENEFIIQIFPKMLNLNDFELKLSIKQSNQDEKFDMIFKKLNDIMKENKELKERVNILEEKLKVYEKQNKNVDKSLNNTWKEICNPWVTETPPLISKNSYKLKNSNYLAEKNLFNGYIYTIKSYQNLNLGNRYKIEFNINSPNGDDIQVGFGNPSKFTGWMKEINSVCLTNEGLFINKEKEDEKYKLMDNKKIVFLVDLKEKEKFFELYINETFINRYNFNFNNYETIFALAAIRKVGNSVNLKTYIST